MRGHHEKDQARHFTLSLSAHKFHGSKGVGALSIKRGAPFHALIKGGRQERDRRAGTQNTPGIVGLGKAAELALECMDEENAIIGSLRNRLEKGLLERVPKTSVNGNPFARLPNTTKLHVWRRRGRSDTIAAQPPLHSLLLRLRRGRFRDFSASPNDPKGAKYLMGLHVMKCMGQTSGRARLFRSRRRWWLPPAASNSPTQILQPLRRFHIDV